MDNQQAIQWFSGFFEGEGCFGFHVRNERNSKLQPYIDIANTSLEAIKMCEKILNNLSINYTVRLQHDTRKPNLKSCYHIRILSLVDVLTFTNYLLPYLECDRKRCLLMNKFCSSRIIRQSRSATNQTEWQIYSEITNWRASTTTREESYSINYSWLAGIYEAEGTFALNWNGTPIIQLVNSNPSIIYKAKEHLNIGCHVKEYKSNNKWQPILYLTLCGPSKFMKFYELVSPYFQFRNNELEIIKNKIKI